MYCVCPLPNTLVLGKGQTPRMQGYGTCSPECYYYQPVQQLPLLSVVQSYIDVWSYSHIACLFLSVPLNPDQPYESTKKVFKNCNVSFSSMPRWLSGLNHCAALCTACVRTTKARECPYVILLSFRL